MKLASAETVTQSFYYGVVYIGTPTKEQTSETLLYANV